MTRERMEMAPNLKMCMTAGIGSDHVDLSAAIEKNITVTEVTFCNSISVAEHVCMQILALVRNYIPAYKIICDGEFFFAVVSISMRLGGVWQAVRAIQLLCALPDTR